MKGSEKFYISSIEGDMILVEIFKPSGDEVTIMIGEKRYDLDMQSAYEFADALLILASEDG